MVRFRVREYTRTIKGAPGFPDYPDYWVYVSDEINDYYEALLYAVNYHKRNYINCWVELIGDEW